MGEVLVKNQEYVTVKIIPTLPETLRRSNIIFLLQFFVKVLFLVFPRDLFVRLLGLVSSQTENLILL